MKNGYKKYGVVAVFALFTIICSRSINEVDNEIKTPARWAEPSLDSYYLAFSVSDELTIDSIYAGEIQYKLNTARRIDTQLDSIHPMPPFELGSILLGISEDLYYSFDDSTLRFNREPIDSLLNIYQPIRGRKLNPISSYCIKLEFAFNYNTPILANKFEDIPGIDYSNANWYGVLAYGHPYNIWIEIINSAVEFTFWIKDYVLEIIHYWIIEVEENYARLTAEWIETL